MADLKTPRNGKPTISGALTMWLGHHPEAVKFLDEWLELRATGDTLWSLKDVLAELKASYGMPAFGDSGLRSWVERNRSEIYRRGGGR
jgi:hypothetical protein